MHIRLEITFRGRTRTVDLKAWNRKSDASQMSDALKSFLGANDHVHVAKGHKRSDHGPGARY